MNSFADLLAHSRLLDLTIPIAPEYPCGWPGQAPMTVERTSWYGEEGKASFHRRVAMNEHCGTHIDAPAHFIPDPALGLPHSTPFGGITADQLKLETLITPAAMLDAGDLLGRAEPGMSPKITVRRVKEWEAENGVLRKGESLLVYTGWSDRFYRKGAEGAAHVEKPVAEKSVPAWPSLDREALAYVADGGVPLLGTDIPSAGALDDIVECHRTALGKGMLFVENLTRLNELPVRGALFIMLPLKLEGGSGAPGRAIAVIPT